MPSGNEISIGWLGTNCTMGEVQLTGMAPEGRNQNTVQGQFEAKEWAHVRRQVCLSCGRTAHPNDDLYMYRIVTASGRLSTLVLPVPSLPDFCYLQYYMKAILNIWIGKAGYRAKGKFSWMNWLCIYIRMSMTNTEWSYRNVLGRKKHIQGVYFKRVAL